MKYFLALPTVLFTFDIIRLKALKSLKTEEEIDNISFTFLGHVKENVGYNP